jgi:hypothetical protein
MEITPALPLSTPSSSMPAAASSAIAATPAAGGQRPVNGEYNFSPRAAGIGKEQFDKIGFDKVGPSSQGWARTTKQHDGSWLTTINVPYGVHLGGAAKENGDTDRYTTLSFKSQQQPSLDGKSRLFISGREITGDLLQNQLAKLGLNPPDFTHFVYGGTAPE